MSRRVMIGVLAILTSCATSSPSALEPIDWGDAGTLGNDCRFYMGDVDIVRPPLEPCEPGLAWLFSTMTCASSTPPTTPSTSTP